MGEAKRRKQSDPGCGEGKGRLFPKTAISMFTEEEIESMDRELRERPQRNLNTLRQIDLLVVTLSTSDIMALSLHAHMTLIDRDCINCCDEYYHNLSELKPRYQSGYQPNLSAAIDLLSNLNQEYLSSLLIKLLSSGDMWQWPDPDEDEDEDEDEDDGELWDSLEDPSITRAIAEVNSLP